MSPEGSTWAVILPDCPIPGRSSPDADVVFEPSGQRDRIISMELRNYPASTQIQNRRKVPVED
ncbi:hypothetical protein T265_11079 [Opisthorchis viverrini]|uniref:Uncharacterized protein n=1 Tax=Opisthorchis viverrini TaxID=6198 RepID=A0A074Z0A8_OPIVI|nr:hypothetical protein T265_11079 [Opisthorchis viverrini]KER20363.1 hypothetical protein T265_11079 [Opisthorchis viverrini]